jgi:hypothetical protein
MTGLAASVQMKLSHGPVSIGDYGAVQRLVCVSFPQQGSGNSRPKPDRAHKFMAS